MDPTTSHYASRKLHSLLGVLPLGAFILEHLYTNAFVLGGQHAYDKQVNWLLSLPKPVLYSLEIVFIALPLLFHGILGAKIAIEGKSNVRNYRLRAQLRATRSSAGAGCTCSPSSSTTSGRPGSPGTSPTRSHAGRRPSREGGPLVASESRASTTSCSSSSRATGCSGSSTSSASSPRRSISRTASGPSASPGASPSARGAQRVSKWIFNALGVGAPRARDGEPSIHLVTTKTLRRITDGRHTRRSSSWAEGSPASWRPSASPSTARRRSSSRSSSVKRSHSVCAQGGINGAVNTKGEGDSPLIHFDDTVYGGDFLANQPPVKAMTAAAPRIIYLLDRMGVMFNRTAEGLLDFRRFGGTRHHRTAFAGATTGQQLLYALDEQVRRHEVGGLVEKFEHWEFLSTILDDEGRARGIVAQDLDDDGAPRVPRGRRDPRDRRARASLRRRSTNSMINTGFAVSVAVPAGREVRERRVHPDPPDRDPRRGQAAAHVRVRARRGRPRLGAAQEGRRAAAAADPGRRALVLPRGEGPGLRQPRAARHRLARDPQGLLRARAWGSAAARRSTSTSRTSRRTCSTGSSAASSRSTRSSAASIRASSRCRSSRPCTTRWAGCGSTTRPSPTARWTSKHPRTQMTSIEGVVRGRRVRLPVPRREPPRREQPALVHLRGRPRGARGRRLREGPQGARATRCRPSSRSARSRAQAAVLADIAAQKGGENPYRLLDELGEMMTAHCTIVRAQRRRCATTLAKLEELEARVARRVVPGRLAAGRTRRSGSCTSSGTWSRSRKIVAAGALARDESRGAHYKPEFEKRDDENWLKTTIADVRSEDARPAPVVRAGRHAVHQAAAARLRTGGGRLTRPMTGDRSSSRSSARTGRSDAVLAGVRGPERRPSMNVISCLMEIQRNPVDGGRAAPTRPSRGTARASRRSAASARWSSTAACGRRARRWSTSSSSRSASSRCASSPSCATCASTARGCSRA